MLRRRLRSIAILLPVLALVVFHLWLFLRHIGDATITRPGVLLRWLFAVLLCGGLALVRRIPVSRRRMAWFIFWLLVAVLHLVGPGTDAVAVLAETIAVLLILTLLGGGIFVAGQSTGFPDQTLRAIPPDTFTACPIGRAPPAR